MVIWNLENIYSEKEETTLINELNNKVDVFISKKELLTNNISIEDFLNLLNLQEEIILLSSKISTKIGLKFCEDVLNKEIIQKMQTTELYLTNLSNKLIFFTHFIKELDEKNAKRLSNNLQKFNYYFNYIRKNIPHTRTLEEEKIINLKNLSGESTLHTIRSLISGKFQFQVDDEILNESEISIKALDENKDVRIKAYDLLLNKYKENQDVFGEIYKGLSLNYYNETVNIRNFKTPISARNFSNTLSDEFVEFILNLVVENRNIFQEYFKLKSKILNVENSRYHVYAPVNIDLNKKYLFNDAKEIVLNTFKEFSQEVYLLANNIFEKQNVHSDILPSKRGGAFCTYYDKDSVPYILLNHTDDLPSLLTMAHELGHGVHGQLCSDKTQTTFHSSTALAETASIFAELLLIENLQKTATIDEKKYLLFHYLDSMFASILRQVYFVLFEKKAHDLIAQGTSVEELNKLYYDLLKEQFSQEMQLPQEFQYEWLRIPHIFELPFYCYSYAFGNLLVLGLYEEYKKQGSIFVDKYLNILKAGGDADIKDILASANIDLNNKDFWQSAINKIKHDLNELKALLDN